MSQNTVGRKMEILLVEDSLTAGTLTMGALKQGDIPHRLTWLTDGQEALNFLHQQDKYKHAPRPDLILLDLTLPKKDGREVLAELKQEDTLQSIPVVIMTSSDALEDRELTARFNVASYVTKPVDLPKFLTLLRELKHFWHADMLLPDENLVGVGASRG